jgi:hypothetical protein
LGLQAALCDTCHAFNIKGENQGAVYVFKGGNWDSTPHDSELTFSGAGGADHIIYGAVPGGAVYNAMAFGDVTGDSKDELGIGAPRAGANVPPVFVPGNVRVLVVSYV